MDPFLIVLIGVVVVVGGIVWLRLHPFVVLIGAAILCSILTPAQPVMPPPAGDPVGVVRERETLGTKLTGPFGRTCASLGLLIAFASIVGTCVLRSGAADRIVQSALAAFGEHRAGLVLAGSGLILGVCVFFDTVFLLLIPVARVMARRTGGNYLYYVLCIAVGTTMTHSLVPPTPGPLYIANVLGVDLGSMMIAGLLLSTAAAGFGLLYARWADQRWPAELPAYGEEDAAGLDPRDAPPLWLSVAPILLPVALIANATTLSLIGQDHGSAAFFIAIGNPTIALAVAALVALVMVATRRGLGRDDVRSIVQTALADGGLIILITAAGGVFGAVLQDTGVGERIQEMSVERRIAILPLAFLITAALRTAGGTSTVAMITAVGIVGPVASPEVTGVHPLYLALTIGCATKLTIWMNDSGFWIICKTSGLRERELLRSLTVMYAIMGLVGFGIVLVAAHFFPLL